MLELYLLISSIASMIMILIMRIFLTLVASTTRTASYPPESYPIIGSLFAAMKNNDRLLQWTSEIVTSSPNLTFLLRLPLKKPSVITANPANVQHILKSNFNNYQKGDYITGTLRDLLGYGMLTSNGDTWRLQRQISSHEFNNKSLRIFIETVVDTQISDRLIPVLKNAAADNTVIDFESALKRFGLDNMCKIAFGYDPGCLSPSQPPGKVAIAIQRALELSINRFRDHVPNFYKIKKALNIGSEKQLRVAVRDVREFAREIIRNKIKSNDDDDLLSRFLSSGNEDLVCDMVITFIIAGIDTTSIALTWFFWLLSKHPEVEAEILKEILLKEKAETSTYDKAKDMVYTHAALCETMRLYPPVPVNGKTAVADDILPDGTVVKKGMTVFYHPYAMGRVEKIWGEDWAEFRPSRWLKKAADGETWSFVNRDPYTYPVFQAGPRICLGKNMAFLQMKTLVVAVLPRFKVVPVVVDGADPVFVSDLPAKMKGGFPVKIQHRN